MKRRDEQRVQERKGEGGKVREARLEQEKNQEKAGGRGEDGGEIQSKEGTTRKNKSGKILL